MNQFGSMQMGPMFSNIVPVTGAASHSGLHKNYVSSKLFPIGTMVKLKESAHNSYPTMMPATKELIAHNKSVGQIKRYIGADELIYQSLEDLKQSASIGNPKITEFEDSVFTGNYRVGNITKDYLVNLENTRSDLIK